MLNITENVAKILGVNINIKGFEVSSKKVQKNYVFFALKGKKVDGHDFLKEAKMNGATVAVVSKDYKGENFGLILVFVDDVFLTLKSLGKMCAENKKNIIGITGSVGKTSTKEFLAQILAKKYKIGKTKESYNGQIGLPVSILNMQGNEDLWILEMGISEPNEMDQLLDVVTLDVAVITKIIMCHVANFKGGMKDIIEEKLKILRDVKKAIVHMDLQKEVKNFKKEIVYYSMNDSRADFFLKVEDNYGVIFEKGKKIIKLPINIREKHFWENILAAIATARFFGFSYEEIKTENLLLPKMRCEKIEKKDVIFINDTYNANPTSMKAALDDLATYKQKKIAVLGPMKELGQFAKQEHTKVLKHALSVADQILVVGDEYKVDENFQKKEKVFFFENLETLTKELEKILTPNSVVLLKGSRSVGVEKIFELLNF